ncbi:MAG TPA: acyl-CoA dehydrogenase family protein [Kofleriaceae bacterium]|nr:acyl-CoA dehydrogenase family protein [Kofleriaceae bacterium]
MFELGEQHAMVGQMVRRWCEANLAPAVPALERGEVQPFDLMRRMARTFGLDAMARAALGKRIARMRAEASAAAGPGDRGGGGDEDGGRDGGVVGGEDGGGGMDDPLLGFVVIKELARVSPGFAMGFGVSVGLAGGAIAARGTADQIERWAVPLATSEKIGSWCLTEPGAGSDAFGSMQTTARPAGAGEDGQGGFVLRGSKTFITNGPGADLFVVYARVDRGEPREEQEVAAFVVERGMAGFTVGPPFKKMGMRDSPTSEIFFDDVRLPGDHLLGDGGGRGRGGRHHTKENLSAERSAVPAMAWGIIERCYEQSLAYARARRQFGRPIGEFQAVQLKLADMYIKLKNVENLVFRTAWMQRRKLRDPAFVNASKAYAAAAAIEVAMTAIQVHGGYGYMEEVGLEKLARDAKLLELGAGTTDINLLAAARAELERT